MYYIRPELKIKDYGFRSVGVRIPWQDRGPFSPLSRPFQQRFEILLATNDDNDDEIGVARRWRRRLYML